MDYVYAVTTAQELARFQSFSNRIHFRLRDYLYFLEHTYQVTMLPNCIVFASAETATKRISSIPLPAYTNENRTVFCPDLAVWKTIYLTQLNGSQLPEVSSYYEAELTENHVLQILGHEFVHHSDLFLDDAYERAQWFEEGMCEYISRKFFLTDEEFQAEARVNRKLVALFEAKYGIHSLECFSEDTYSESYAAIFYFYWKSFLAVQEITDRMGGDVMAVFQEYHRWFMEKPAEPLSSWFAV